MAVRQNFLYTESSIGQTPSVAAHGAWWAADSETLRYFPQARQVIRKDCNVMQNFANEFSEILDVLTYNTALQAEVLKLILTDNITGKVLEGGTRDAQFRDILQDLVAGRTNLNDAYSRTEKELPRAGSVHAASNRVFPYGWSERLVRTQLSRFYNQAVMELLMTAGAVRCFVPHSSAEDSDTECSRNLAGAEHDVHMLYSRLIDAYRNGNFSSKDVKIPDHPHCTHTVIPVP